MAKKILLVIAVLTALFLIWFFYKSENKDQADFNRAEKYLKEGKTDQALSVIKPYQDHFADNKGNNPWLLLFLKTIQNDPRLQGSLAQYYRQFPEAFKHVDEDTALQTASALIGKKEFDLYRQLKEEFSLTTKEPGVWKILDIDSVRAGGERETAIKMLETLQTTGKPEVLRLMRLSFLTEKQDPKRAWDYLIEASRVDPTNPDLRSLRGALLEKVGKLSLAQKEYQDALTLKPQNADLWDQLAQFYIRQGQWTRALITWQHALTLPNSESIWINLIFWSKVVRPLDYKLDLSSLADSHLKHFITYLYELPQDKFWDSEKYRSVEKGAELLQTFQQTFWLRLLQTLKDNDLKQAFDLIAFNPFRNKSYRIDLEAATLLAVNYQLNHTLDVPDAIRNDLSINVDPALYTRAENHQLLRLLNIDKRDTLIDDQTDALLRSPSIFPVLYAAGGWYNASVNLNFPEKVDPNWPSYTSFTLTQALRVIDGNDKALAYAMKQPMTDELELLIGQIYENLNNQAEAEKHLKKIYTLSTPVGIKAAWDLTLLKINQKKYDEALNILSQSSNLETSVIGKELKARIALLKGDDNLALELYSQIVSSSYEAKIYLANYYLKQNDIAASEKLARELLIEFPTNPQVLELIQKINHSENSKQP